MVVHAHTLSAQAFADEVPVRVNLLGMKGVSEMSVGLGTCLQALRGLQDTLGTFPDVSASGGSAVARRFMVLGLNMSCPSIHLLLNRARCIYGLWCNKTYSTRDD